ncbi:MAG: ThuA domain-containing protein [Myxococcales bacterium]|nr:ThuA domain-containing protein [Myxococcales bacterium]
MWWMWMACSGPTTQTTDPPPVPTGSTASTSSTADTATTPPVKTTKPPPLPPRVLLFTKTEGFRHDSIDVAVPAITEEGTDRGWTVTHTDDAAAFTVKGLQAFDVVVFLLTTGDVLDVDQQAAMEAFVNDGGGFAGVHSATDTEYGWPWYGELVGAYFDGHPAVQEAELTVDDATHPATAHLKPRFSRTDEWYAFRENPRDTVDVLLSLDESTYDPGSNDMDGDHPIAWSQTIHGGRSFYSAGGHTLDSFAEPDFLQHLAEGIEWAAGR